MPDRSRRPRSPLRQNIDNLALGVIAVLLLKHFVVGLYRVPSASMVPTLVGSDAAGVFDRVLVDRLHYLLHEPARWDVAAFRHHLNRSRSYAKRIVGLPGERLCIAGGNLYRAKPGVDPADARALEPLRRPPSIQEQHWLDVHPARMRVRGDAHALERALHGSGGRWSADGDTLIVTQPPDGAWSTLTFPGDAAAGLVDDPRDGVPTDVARAIAPDVPLPAGTTVQDARIGMTIGPSDAVAALRIELELRLLHGVSTTFALISDGGRARMVVEQDGREAAAGPSFPLELGAGSTTAIRFTHLDDRCRVEVDGRTRSELDCAGFRTLQGLEPEDGADHPRATLRLSMRGGGRVTLTDLRIERDVHYRPSNRPQLRGPRVLDVPEAHYLVLGDHSRWSVDARDWTAITVGVDAEGAATAPYSATATRMLRGEWAVPAADAELELNPLPVPEHDVLLFFDEYGQPWILRGELELPHLPGSFRPVEPPWIFAGGQRFRPAEEPAPFVARDQLLGRPVFRIWPPWPWWRIGVVR